MHPRIRPIINGPLLLVLVAALVVSACAADDGDAAMDDETLAVAPASFDVSVGDDVRLLAGIFAPDRALLAFGQVTFELGPVGDDPQQVALTQRATASWLAVPGEEPDGSADQPRFLDGEPGSGVYAANVDFDQPGTWVLQVNATLEDGSQRSGTALFEVQPEPLVPAVGDPAPRTANLTIADVEAGDAPARAVDSRAQDGTDIPDPHLHETRIPDAIDAQRPVVVAITTPVYCVSRFCGPLTEVVSDLAREYEDRAAFVHIEVWHDFDEQQLTDAAAAWIQTDVGGNEPWVFLIDANGDIIARWDNVLDVDELEAALEAL